MGRNGSRGSRSLARHTVPQAPAKSRKLIVLNLGNSGLSDSPQGNELESGGPGKSSETCPNDPFFGALARKFPGPAGSRKFGILTALKKTSSNLGDQARASKPV